MKFRLMSSSKQKTMSRRTIAIILKSFGLSSLTANVTFSELLRGFREECHRRDMHPVFFDTLLDVSAFFRSKSHRAYDGIIGYATWEHREALPVFERLAADRPFVHLLAAPRDDIAAVCTDEDMTMRLVVDHLVREGIRTIGFGEINNDVYSMRRFQSFKKAMLARNLELRPEWVFGINAVRGTFTAPARSGAGTIQPGRRETAFSAEFMALKERPRALVCETDHLAYHFAQAAGRRGLSIPGDIAVTGVDNLRDILSIESRVMKRLKETITTVDQDYYTIARESVKMLDGIIRKRLPRRGVVRMVKPHLIVRSSSQASSIVKRHGKDDVFRISVVAYLNRHLSDAARLDTIAAAHALTHESFLKKFKRVFGRSYPAEINDRRLAKADRLLTGTSRSVKRIADEAGYTTYENFNKFFKRKYGMTPAAYRTAQRTR